MAAAWAYSDWITYPAGSATRLQRLQLHAQEVSNATYSGDYTVNGRTISVDSLNAYLNQLYEREKFEGEQVGIATGSRLGMTSGRALLDTYTNNDPQDDEAQ